MVNVELIKELEKEGVEKTNEGVVEKKLRGKENEGVVEKEIYCGPLDLMTLSHGI